MWCRLREVEKERKAEVGTDVSLIQELTLQSSLEARNSALETRFHSHSHPNDDFFFHCGGDISIPAKFTLHESRGHACLALCCIPLPADACHIIGPPIK